VLADWKAGAELIVGALEDTDDTTTEISAKAVSFRDNPKIVQFTLD